MGPFFLWNLWADSADRSVNVTVAKCLVPNQMHAECCLLVLLVVLSRMYPRYAERDPDKPVRASRRNMIHSEVSSRLHHEGQLDSVSSKRSFLFYSQTLHIWLTSNYNPYMWFSSIFLHNTLHKSHLGAPPDILNAVLGFPPQLEPRLPWPRQRRPPYWFMYRVSQPHIW